MTMQSTEVVVRRQRFHNIFAPHGDDFPLHDVNCSVRQDPTASKQTHKWEKYWKSKGETSRAPITRTVFYVWFNVAEVEAC